jgi:hypothetical protein
MSSINNSIATQSQIGTESKEPDSYSGESPVSEVVAVHNLKTRHSNFYDSHTVQDTMMRSGKLWRADLSIEPATSKPSGQMRASQCSRKTLKDYFEALCLSVAERTGSVKSEGFPESATPLERAVIHERILEERTRVLACLD